ncbi:MAG: hypothetical protein Q4G42_08595 [Neisseria sp.]|nr:hypothetical protein [Neisseria sp.]
MKKIALGLIVMFSSALCAAQGAQTPQEAELLSAQVAYSQALKKYNADGNRIPDIQVRLDNANRRLQEAQSDVQRAEQELAAARAAHSAADAELKAAGARLDAAWAASRGQ